MDQNRRLLDEIAFFNEQGEIIYKQKKSFKVSNAKDYKQLFSDIPHLRPITNFFGEIKNKKILDLGCGDGWASLYFARSGSEVYSVDVSAKLISIVKKYSETNDLFRLIHPIIMQAEKLSFKNNSFDFVFVNAALHHFDIEKAIREIKRVLKPKGKGVLIEDLKYHFILRLYRFFTPSKHTKYEKPLTIEDIKKINSTFSNVEFKYYKLSNIFNSNNLVTKKLDIFDQWINKTFPYFKKYNRIIVIYVTK